MRQEWRNLVVVLLVLGMAQFGCARMARGKLLSSNEKVVDTRPVIKPSAEFVVVQGQMQGTELFLEAGAVCKEVKQIKIETTTEYSRRNDTPSVTTATAVIGGLAVAIGIAMMINPETEDEETGEKSKMFDDQQTAYIAGGITVGAGGFLLLFPLGDAIRKSLTDVETETHVETKDVIRPVVACKQPKKASDVDLWGDIGGRVVHLGVTDHQGRLSVDLARLIDRETISGPVTVLEMALIAQLGDEPLEVVDSTLNKRVIFNLSEVHSYFDDVVWGEVDLTSCMAAASLDACRSVEHYLDQFPTGKHVVEANQYLMDVKARMDALREAEARRQELELERLRKEAVEREREEERKRKLAEQKRKLAEQKRKAEQAKAQAEYEAAMAKQKKQQAAAKKKAECKKKCKKSCHGIAECVKGCVRDTCH